MAIKVRDAEKALEAAGWTLQRMGKGSHAIYKKPGVPYTIALPVGHAKDIATGTWEKIKKQAGIAD